MIPALSAWTLENLLNELPQDLISFLSSEARYLLSFLNLLHIWFQPFHLLWLLDQGALGWQKCSESSQWLAIVTELPLCQAHLSPELAGKLKDKRVSFHSVSLQVQMGLMPGR